MTSISSTASIAQTHATDLSSAAEPLASTQTVTLDELSTIAGNYTANNMITNLSIAAVNIKTVVQTAGNNLNSVASEFEAVDQAGAKSFQAGS